MRNSKIIGLFKYFKKSDYLLILMWILAFIIINPIGEFPINDDWAYAKMCII